MPDRGWAIEELEAHHDRSAFCCGHDSLDDFLKKFAAQNQKTGISRTYVAVRPRQRVVRGYYSISAGAVRFVTIPEELRRRLPKYPVPVAHLGRLAVDRTAQGERLGELLLLDSMAKTVGAADAIGIHAIEVVAIDEPARCFYSKYGFVGLLDDPHHLYLSIATVRKLKLA